MARDRDLLSDKEMMRSVLDIVEHITNTNIKLFTVKGNNYVRNDLVKQEEWTMNISIPAIPNISKYTALAHECGHILARSPVTSTRKLILRWIKNKPFDEQNNYKKMYWNCFNIIEDQRVEYYIMNIWRANKKRFIDTRINLGIDMKESFSPADHLLAVRFYREDLVKCEEKDIYINCIKKVEGTGRYGAVKILIMLKPLIDKWFTNHDGHTLNNPVENSFPDNKTIQDGSSDPKTNDDSEEIDEDVESELNIESMTESLQDEYESYKTEIQLMEEKMAVIEKPHLRKEFKIVDRDNKLYSSYDRTVAHTLSKLFRSINELNVPSTDYTGDEVDVDTYIDLKAQGKDITKSMVSSKPKNGLSVVISVDGSGSMAYDQKIDKVKYLLNTLYRSIDGVKNIDIKANVWSSNNMGTVGITNINNIKEVGMISLTPSFQLTPTHLALEYSSKQLSDMKGNKKLLIIITDGMPEYRSNDYLIPVGNMIKMSKKSLYYALRKTPNIMCILVGKRNGTRFYDNTDPNSIMTNIFGKKRYMRYDDMDAVSERVIKEFRRLVIRTLR